MGELQFSSGNLAFDRVIQGVLPGDNIVLQVDSITDYIPFVRDFYRYAVRNQKPLIYFRFGNHEDLLPADIDIKRHQLRPELGFELFIGEIFAVIEKEGIGACYIFDSLSDLAVDWYSDIMTANFFMLTCPYLYDYKTVTFFAVIRTKHAEAVLSDIHNTAQVIVNVFRDQGVFYLHPIKVTERMSQTMYMLHKFEGGEYKPVMDSINTATILTTIPSICL